MDRDPDRVERPGQLQGHNQESKRNPKNHLMVIVYGPFCGINPFPQHYKKFFGLNSFLLFIHSRVELALTC